MIRLLRMAEPFDSHVCRGGSTSHRRPVTVAAGSREERQPRRNAAIGAAIHQSIRRRAAHAGYDPTALAKLGGHSLRAGFVTQGTRNGADGSAIARQTGHASLDSVEVYRREHAPLVGNAVTDIGL